VALADDAGDEEYLAALAANLFAALDLFRPDIVFYQAGVDPYRDDRLGRLALTMEGLGERDHFVFQSCRERSLPCVITLGGGYARDVSDTVEAHCNTLREARAVFNV
jgi:acetoin utilization deacetylase AcuC-like enzyme